MSSSDVVSFKIYLENEDLTQSEVRRFGIHFDAVKFDLLTSRLLEVFPQLSGKVFTVYWKDEDNDDVRISSDEDLFTAISEMKSNIKKLHVVLKENNSQSDSDVSHPMIICDGCNQKILGCRYKCIVCSDYDLCRKCEKDLHFEHPMLRIGSPLMFSHESLRKLVRLTSSFGFKKSGKHGHHHYDRKTRGYDLNSDVCRKKRKCDKYDSETDDSDKQIDGKHKKHHRSGMLQLLMNDVLAFLDPVLLEGDLSKGKPSKCNKGSAAAAAATATAPAPAAAADDDNDDEEPHHVKYLRNVGNTIVSLLDPLGINVDVEVRAKDYNKKDKTEKKEKKENNAEKQEPSTSKGSDSQKKEVRFTDSEKAQETLNEKIEQITNILAKQMVNESPEREDWVSYEELKRSVNETSKEAEPTSPSCPQTNEQSPTTSSGQESKNLYPKLQSQQFPPMDSFIKQSLEKMLAMGFTNDGDWLRQLLEAKKGDISQVVEALAPHKK